MNRKLIIGIVAVILLIAAGGYFLFFNKSNTPTTTSSQEQSIPLISAKDIGLTLTPGADRQRVTLTVTNTQDIASIDYELSYLSKNDVPRGALGHLDVKTPGQPVKTSIYLGTCSDVCQ